MKQQIIKTTEEYDLLVITPAVIRLLKLNKNEKKPVQTKKRGRTQSQTARQVENLSSQIDSKQKDDICVKSAKKDSKKAKIKTTKKTKK